MTTEVATAQTFEERVINKLKTDMGSLMTDAELKKLVSSAMEKIFFAEQQVKTGHWNEYKRVPAEFVAVTKELLAPRLQEALKLWLDEHPEEVQKCIDLVLKENLIAAVVGAFQSLLSPAFGRLQNEICSVMEAHRRNDHHLG